MYNKSFQSLKTRGEIFIADLFNIYIKSLELDISISSSALSVKPSGYALCQVQKTLLRSILCITLLAAKTSWPGLHAGIGLSVV